jgi:Sigma-70 region 2
VQGTPTVGIADKCEITLVCEMCIADRYPMMSDANIRASGLFVGKNSTVQSQSFSSCQYASTCRLMMNARSEDAAAAFEPLRPKLMRVAYRMLGSVADAEDMVQEAFIRWMSADLSEVREPEAFLRRTVTRLCLDQLKSARRRRETYVGPWPIPSWKRKKRKTSPCR